MKTFPIIFIALLFCFFQPLSGQNLVGHWTFEPGQELVDQTGNFASLTFVNGTQVQNGALEVRTNPASPLANNSTGSRYAFTTANPSFPTLTEKTLVSWVRLRDLSHRGGAVLSIDKQQVDNFDAIVLGEIQVGEWMAGSSFFNRTQNLSHPQALESSTGDLICMAISYENVGGTAHVKVFRNGIKVGDYTQGSIETWNSSNAEIIFGARHTAGNPFGQLDADIEEAQVYDGVLSESAILALCQGPVASVPTLGQWGLIMFGLLMLCLGSIAIYRRRPATVPA